ncbi:beta clamp domain-containing protein [Natrinema pellirubrum]|uniref:hypothetical protein n=1 Tax=Natrinema pellirubrum TaxID=69525 RepID=UPI0023A9B1E3|nr:hypothetical protein [Natrinema pellirubrum]
MSYSLAPKEISSINEPPQNEIDHEITVWTHSGVFRRSNKILSMADEEIVFNFTDDGVYVSASGDADSAEINLEASDEDNQDGADIVFDEKKKELQARFSSDYIEYIPKFTPNGLFKSNFDSKNPLEINTRRVEEKILTQIRLAQRLQPEG